MGLPAVLFPDSKRVRVNQEFSADLFVCFDEPSIPIDHRTYAFFGETILPGVTRILSRFVINTKTSTLLAGSGHWYIGGKWFRSFEPEAMELLGVDVNQSRPFSWTPNVPIQTIEQPPYLEGVALHALTPPSAAAALPQALSGEKVGGGWLTSVRLEVAEPTNADMVLQSKKAGKPPRWRTLPDAAAHSVLPPSRRSPEGREACCRERPRSERCHVQACGGLPFWRRSSDGVAAGSRGRPRRAFSCG
jgi:hypothetical protein